MTTRTAITIGGLPLALAAAFQFTPPSARLDDAYITLHSARVVLSGHDPVYNVPALIGITSPLYLALVAAILAPGLVAGDTALRLANAAGIVAFAAAVWRLGTTFSLTTARRLILVAASLASGMVMVNLSNGLETGWAMAVLTFAIASARAGQPKAVACAAGLLPFLRPDLAPASAAVLWYALRGRPRSEQALVLAVTAAAALPFLIWMRVDTGEWLPQTMRAKAAYYAQSCWPVGAKTTTVLRDLTGPIVQLFPLSLGLWFLARDWLGRAGLIAMALSIGAYFVELPDALAHTLFRYVYGVVVPWMCLGVAGELGRVPTGAAIAMSAGLLVVRLTLPHGIGMGYSSDEMKAASVWIDANLPRDAVLLVHDAGGISEYAHHRAVDFVGLKTPSTIAAHLRWTLPSCGAERGTAVTAIARASDASYLVILTGWDVSLHQDFERAGIALTPVREPPRDQRGYIVYRMQASAGPAMQSK